MFLKFNPIFIFPWLSLNLEVFFLEVFFLGFFFNLVYFKSFFKFYANFFFLLVILMIFLGYLNVDIFINFFFLIELTALLVILLFFLYLNIDLKQYYNKNYFFILLLVFFFLNFFYIRYDTQKFAHFFMWVDFYSANNYLVINDLFSLSLSFYYVNSTFFLFSGFLIFFATIVILIIFTISNLKIFNVNVKLKKLGKARLFVIANNISRTQDIKEQKFSKTKLRILKKK